MIDRHGRIYDRLLRRLTEVLGEPSAQARHEGTYGRCGICGRAGRDTARWAEWSTGEIISEGISYGGHGHIAARLRPDTRRKVDRALRGWIHSYTVQGWEHWTVAITDHRCRG